MSATQTLRRVATSPNVQPLAVEILVDVNQVSTAGQFLELALPKMVATSRATRGAVYRP